MSVWGSNPGIGDRDSEGAPPGVVLEARPVRTGGTLGAVLHSTGGLYPRPERDDPAAVAIADLGRWLRLAVTIGGTAWPVVLNTTAAISLRDEFTAWLEQPKVRPR